MRLLNTLLFLKMQCIRAELMCHNRGLKALSRRDYIKARIYVGAWS